MWCWGALALAAAWTARDRPLPLWVLLAIAAAFRGALIGAPPLLSDDLFRYLWEGTLLDAGGNPFATPPAVVSGLNDALRDQVNHPEYGSIYPPLALVWFRLAALGGVAWIQALTAAADLVVVAAIARVAQRPWPALLYALHPLPVVESALGAHLEVPAVALTAVAIALWRRSPASPGFSAATIGLLGAGAAVKLFPALLLPVALRRKELGAQALALCVVGLACTVVMLPLLEAGPALWASLEVYGRTWSFNGLLFPLLEPVLGGATRPLLAAGGAVAVAAAWWVHRAPLGAWAVAGATFVLLSPTVHPWYLLWPLVPALMRDRWGWAAASVPMLGSYAVLVGLDPVTGAWEMPWWLPWITWPPALVALAAAAWDRAREAEG